MKWRTNFINSGQSLHRTSIETLKTYMVYQEQQTETQRRKRDKKNGRKTSQNHNSNRRSRHNSNTHASPRSGLSTSNLTQKKRRGNALKWGQCHQNQYCDNFRPRRQSSGNPNGSHFTSSSSSRNSPRTNTNNSIVPPSLQVYFNQYQPWSNQSETNSYLTMPSHGQSFTQRACLTSKCCAKTMTNTTGNHHSR